MASEYIGLLGTAMGAAIAAGAGILLNWRNSQNERRQWTRDTRQQAYTKFLSAGTSLHRACEEIVKSTESDRDRALQEPSKEFDEAYIALQIVSDKAVFLAAREYNYWFPDLLRVAIEGNREEVSDIGRQVRKARHSFLAAVRRELGLIVDKELLPELP